MAAGDYSKQVPTLAKVPLSWYHVLWRPALRDPSDEFVLELAVAAGCSAIVTHNVRHFAGARTFGVEILTPAEFIARVEESQ